MGKLHTRLPDVEEQRIVDEALRRMRLMTSPVTGTGGGGGGGGGSGGTPVTGSPWVPTLIDTSETFTVPENTQILWSVPITILGTLDIQGSFVMVN